MRAQLRSGSCSAVACGAKLSAGRLLTESNAQPAKLRHIADGLRNCACQLVILKVPEVRFPSTPRSTKNLATHATIRFVMLPMDGGMDPLSWLSLKALGNTGQ